MHLPLQLETDRLIVREWTPDDAEAHFAIYRDPEVMRFLGGNSAPRESVEQCREGLVHLQELMVKRREKGHGFWAVADKASNTPVGSVLLKPLPYSKHVGEGESDDIEIGWHLGRDHWGNGYATEAAGKVLRYGVSDLGLSEVHAVLFQENARSRAVAERLGMVYEDPTDRYYDLILEHFTIGQARE